MINQFINKMINIVVITCALYVFIYLGMDIYVSSLIKEKPINKPISYPEEIQAVRAGDTLYVSSVSDSIYIGFKQFKNK